MMSDYDQLPILEQLQPAIKRLYLVIKAEKERQGKTNQDIAEHCGIPLSSVGKFFSGIVEHPNANYIASVCIYLGISIDSLYKKE